MGLPERVAQFKVPDRPDRAAAVRSDRLFRPAAGPLVADEHRRLAAEALSRLFMLPGAHYSAPELSWKFEVAPGGIGFPRAARLGLSTATTSSSARLRLPRGGAYVFRLNLTGNRRKIGVDDPRLDDLVADNLNKWEITESESLLGRNFGIVTDIQTGPNGNLYLVSLSNGVVYEVFRR